MQINGESILVKGGLSRVSFICLLNARINLLSHYLVEYKPLETFPTPVNGIYKQKAQGKSLQGAYKLLNK